VKSILHGPMASHGYRQLFGSQLARADVIAPLEVRLFVADLAQGVDQTDRLALGPISQVDSPFRGQHGGDLADDPTTGLVGLAVAVDGFRLVLVKEISLDRFQQRRLIAFDREQVVTALVGDLTGDVLLAPHGVNGDQQVLDLQCLEQFRDGGDFITLGGDLFLAQNDAQFRGEGTDHVNGGFTAAAGPTHRLAIDRNAAIEGPDYFSDPAAERHLELLRGQRPEDPQKRLLGGDGILEGQELTQSLLLFVRPIGDIFDGVTIGEHGGHGNHQNLHKIMQRPIAGFARVVDFPQAAHQAGSLRHSHFGCPKDESRPDSRGVYKPLS